MLGALRQARVHRQGPLLADDHSVYAAVDGGAGGNLQPVEALVDADGALPAIEPGVIPPTSVWWTSAVA
mgnify:CR=1 FL=1